MTGRGLSPAPDPDRPIVATWSDHRYRTNTEIVFLPGDKDLVADHPEKEQPR